MLDTEKPLVSCLIISEMSLTIFEILHCNLTSVYECRKIMSFSLRTTNIIRGDMV